MDFKRDNDFEADALGSYLSSIRHLEVLPPEEINSLAEDMEREEAVFRAAMLEIPGTALELWELWQQRKDSGLVTGVLSSRFRDGSGRDWTRQIDQTLGALGPLLEERCTLRTGRRPPARRLAELDEAIAEHVAKAEVCLEILLEMRARYEALLAAPHAEVAQPKRRLELNTPGARAAMKRAARALETHARAKERFVRHNLRLVINLSKRYRNMGVPFTDLIQEGNLGLIRAVEKYDRHRGYRFSTYAVWWITQALIRVIQNQSRTIRAPSQVYELHYRRRRAEAELRRRLGRQPTDEEMAAHLDVSLEKLQLSVDAMKPLTSLQATLPGMEDRTLENVLEDPEARDPGETIEQDQQWGRVEHALRGLEERERRILEWRFGLRGKPELTLQQIGQRLGLSRERVRQIESHALRHLREQDELQALVA
jgi:RNA polymerase sigma factor (sigma-70 family)